MFSLTGQGPSARQLGFVALIIAILVVFLNPGFIGTDEYWTGITRYIPAQTSDLHHLVNADDVKSPVQILPMHFFAQMALSIGIQSPFAQYHFVVVVLGLLNFLILLWSFSQWKKELPEAESKILFFLLAFYFAAPFIFTRPMFESLSAPWMSWAGLFAFRYDRKQNLKDLFWGVFCISMSFVLRPQTGLCALVFIVAPLLYRNWSHVIAASGFGIFLLFVSGLPDLWLRGSWHFSVLALTQYNFAHGHEYGQQPWTFYPLLLIAVSFAPFIAHRVPAGWLQEYFQKYRSLWLMLFLFVFLHSLFSQKFERFLIPVLPWIFILMAPWIASLIAHQHWKRLYLISIINALLWLASSFQPAQNNIILFSRYLDQHPEVKSIFRVDNTPEWIPDAFIQRIQFKFIDISAEQISQLALSCSDRLVLPESIGLKPQGLGKPWILDKRFAVNWIEWIAFKFNPKNNLRRTELFLWGPSGCEG